jgi:hypothetical protein
MSQVVRKEDFESRHLILVGLGAPAVSVGLGVCVRGPGRAAGGSRRLRTQRQHSHLRRR